MMVAVMLAAMVAKIEAETNDFRDIMVRKTPEFGVCSLDFLHDERTDRLPK